MTDLPSRNAANASGVHSDLKSERIGERPLTETQINVRLRSLPGWAVVGDGTMLWRTFEFPSFRAAVAFVSYVVEVAEAMDHRPGIELQDDTVILTLTTHSAGGLTDEDFALAARIRA